jgi:hypothetical protein
MNEDDLVGAIAINVVLANPVLKHLYFSSFDENNSIDAPSVLSFNVLNIV